MAAQAVPATGSLSTSPSTTCRDPHPGDIVVFRAPTDVWFNEPLPATPIQPDRCGVCAGSASS